jgi:glutathione synthase/RimK-type ligase-like ATP-grasp enzyme
VTVRTCAFATYADLPRLDPDDVLAAVACAALDIEVVPAVWDDPGVDWARFDACVVRSTWDYPRRADAFAAWIDRVEAATTVWNSPATLRWNMHKGYMRDLAARGVPIVPTAIVERRTPLDLDAFLRERAWSDAIVKPAHGAATLGVRRVEATPASVARAQRHVDGLLADVDVLVQPFLRSVTAYRERALVFIDGAYSHAATKEAFQGLEVAGGAGERPVTATQQEIVLAQRALAAIAGDHLYARVDLVRDDADAPVVIEVELIEPSLFLAMHPPAAARFAAALAKRLDA